MDRELDPHTRSAAHIALAGRLAESLEHYRAILDTAVDGSSAGQSMEPRSLPAVG